MSHPHRAGWAVRTSSVRGAAHKRADRPNEDAVLGWEAADGRAAVACVADGHGSARCFRADTGARVAVDVGRGHLQALVERIQGPDDLRARATEVARSVIAAWRSAVLDHARTNPFSPAELATAGTDAPDVDAVLLSYGTTLLGVAVTANWRLLLQLGDGDILEVSDGRTVRRPLGGAAASGGFETSSLATASPDGSDFVMLAQGVSPHGPELYLLATDGYANSFVDDAAFRAVGSDLWHFIRQEGLERVTDRLPGWLETASAQGSGDDISIALVAAIGQEAG